MRPTTALALMLALAVWLAPLPGRAQTCAPWPGEPSPLPTTASADALAAQWAQQRVHELVAAAERLEAAAPSAAHRVWRHAACLDPERADLAAAIARTRPLRVHRPEPVRGRISAPPRAASVEAALAPIRASLIVVAGRPAPAPAEAALEASRPSASAPAPPTPEPPAVSSPPTPEPTPSEPPLAALDGRLDEAETLIRSARFEEALQALGTARVDLVDLRAENGAAARHARLELLTGTAEVALGRENEAQASFARALAVDPGLRLDPATTSPKVVRTFERAREKRP